MAEIIAQNKNKKVLIVLVDALRFDYLNREDLPFLSSLAEKGCLIKQIEPGYGFCERSEILTGAGPRITGNFSAYTYCPERSPFQFLHRWLFITKSIDYVVDFLSTISIGLVSRVFDKIYRNMAGRLLRIYRRSFSCFDWNRIPFRMFHLISLTEDITDHTAPGAFKIPSIYDLLRKEGKTWYHGFQDLATDMSDSYATALEKLYNSFEENRSFYCFALGHIDTFTHKYGTSLDVRKEILPVVDKMIRDIYTHFVEANPDGHILFFGDHGMLDVEETFDAESEIKGMIAERGLRVPEDVMYFLDSTMVRIWGPKSGEIEAEFHAGGWAKKGLVVDADLRDKFGIATGDFNYGDVIWWANPGVVVFPDFFRRVEPPKGMHGYDVEIAEHQGLGVLLGPGVEASEIERGRLVDIAPTVERLLGLPIPAGVEGRPWVEVEKGPEL